MQHIILARAVSPYLNVYQWNDPGFGVATTNPSADFSAQLHSIDVNYNSNAVVFSGNSQFAYIYPFTKDGFGVKYANPSTAHIATNDVKFSPDGSIIFYASSNSKTVRAYPFDKATGFGTVFPQPSVIPGYGTNAGGRESCPNHAGNVIFFGGRTIPAVTTGSAHCAIYRWDNVTGFGTKFTIPNAAIAHPGYEDVLFAPNDTHVVLSSQYIPTLNTYEWSNTTGVGVKITSPSVGGNGYYQNRSRFNHAGNVYFDASGNYIVAYPWDPVTGYGVKYTQPTIEKSPDYSLNVSLTDGSLFCSGGGTYSYAYYPWNNVTGFGVGTRSVSGFTSAYDTMFIDFNLASSDFTLKINISDQWKEVASMKVNIGGEWKDIALMKVNISDQWKDLI